jgi:hypothetical protein
VPEGSTHPLLQATPDRGRTRWILILCAWTIVGLLFVVRRIVVVKVQGTHVSWVIVGALELVYWYVWAAYTPLVIGLAKRFPLTGPRFVPHIAIHTITSLMMAPLASVTEYFLSRGLLRSVFRTTDPGLNVTGRDHAKRLLDDETLLLRWERTYQQMRAEDADLKHASQTDEELAGLQPRCSAPRNRRLSAST